MDFCFLGILLGRSVWGILIFGWCFGVGIDVPFCWGLVNHITMKPKYLLEMKYPLFSWVM